MEILFWIIHDNNTSCTGNRVAWKLIVSCDCEIELQGCQSKIHTYLVIVVGSSTSTRLISYLFRYEQRVVTPLTLSWIINHCTTYSITPAADIVHQSKLLKKSSDWSVTEWHRFAFSIQRLHLLLNKYQLVRASFILVLDYLCGVFKRY